MRWVSSYGPVMPPQCCRCNGKGRCRGCVCVRSGKACISCMPSRSGRCENLDGAKCRIETSPLPEPSEQLHQPEDRVNETVEMGEGYEREEHYQLSLWNNNLPDVEFQFTSLQSMNCTNPMQLSSTHLPSYYYYYYYYCFTVQG